jgi:hypothetical protein
MAASRAQPDSALVQRPAAIGGHPGHRTATGADGRLADAGDSDVPDRCPMSKGRLPSGSTQPPCQMAGPREVAAAPLGPYRWKPVQLAGAGPAEPVRNTRPCRLADQPRDLATGAGPPSRDAAGRAGGCRPVPGSWSRSARTGTAPTSPPRRATSLMCSWHSSAPLHLTPHALRPRRFVTDLKTTSRPAWLIP